MKHVLLMLTLMSVMTGCNASEGKSISELEAEVAQKQAALEAAKKTGGYPTATPRAVCVNGVVYYSFNTYGGDRVYSPAISSENLAPKRCNGTSE